MKEISRKDVLGWTRMEGRCEWLLVALGNPNAAHGTDRHNAGKIALAAAARALGCGELCEGEVRACEVGGICACFYETASFMNLSGQEVGRLVRERALPLGRLVVWHDDVDLPLGVVRISWAARSGGHRGVESVARAVGSLRWWRVRVGVAPRDPRGAITKPPKERLADWLVAPANATELACYRAQGEAAGTYLAAQWACGTLQPVTLRLACEGGGE